MLNTENIEETILHNIRTILLRIENACKKCNRNPNEVCLLLATKTVTTEHIKIALEAGYTLIGENKVQELREKYEELKAFSYDHHFIGHLQTNKIKDILKYGVSCIQSVDRLDLAQKLHQRLLSENKTMEILIQVNTSDEESKYGVHPDKAIELIQQAAQLKTLKICGLMTIGLFSAETKKVRRCFRILKKLQQQIDSMHIPNVEMEELSMGMSSDLETAIEEGATIVRVGTAIFGQRQYPDSYYWNESK
ncbi:YggS family pyridoxal phosphate-dependent enzyme [Elizabethkingia meningoseptica]|uniref:YggS family pyridoxal phosphate-dependent enzyme n=1 Tax=Elizabethkingia meningoseptica TaxID=238 RepID=UPI0038911B63